jgi:UDP-3-O-[3-hydroxymyristoyl] glucosamine N-acyltransferase
MRFNEPVPLSQIAALIGAEIVGNEGLATGINEIHKVAEGDLVFVDHPKYYRTCIESAATSDRFNLLPNRSAIRRSLDLERW